MTPPQFLLPNIEQCLPHHGRCGASGQTGRYLNLPIAVNPDTHAVTRKELARSAATTCKKLDKIFKPTAEDFSG